MSLFSQVWRIRGRKIINQDISAIPANKIPYVRQEYLPILLHVWKIVEDTTKFRWRATSYIRSSPSHRQGIALDIAPDIAPTSKKFYAVTNMSDPVLYKRERLIRLLQKAVRRLPIYKYDVGVFVEPDHLHISLFRRRGKPSNRLFKWGIYKPVYPDSSRRMKLPLIRS